MPGYKHSCRYCNGLVEGDARFCPFCGRINPAGPPRCPACAAPVEQSWKACTTCGLKLEGACPHCGQTGFLVDYCPHCQVQLTMTCPNRKCRSEQPLLRNICADCGKPLKAK